MVLEKLDERGMMSEICDAMDLNHLLDREATQVYWAIKLYQIQFVDPPILDFFHHKSFFLKSSKNSKK